MRTLSVKARFFIALISVTLGLLVVQIFTTSRFSSRCQYLAIDTKCYGQLFHYGAKRTIAKAPEKPVDVQLELARRRVESIGVNMYHFAFQKLQSDEIDVAQLLDLCRELRDRISVLNSTISEISKTMALLIHDDGFRSATKINLTTTFYNQFTVLSELRRWVDVTEKYFEGLPSAMVKNGSSNTIKANQIEHSIKTLHGRFLELLRSWTAYSNQLIDRPARIEALKDKILQRWTMQQFPGNCSVAKKLLCGSAGLGGFAVNVRWIDFCFWLAYISGRVLQFDASQWLYTAEPWVKIFQPITNCSEISHSVPFYSERTEKELAVKLDFDYSNLWHLAENRLRSMPLDIADELQLVDLDPFEFIGGLIARFVFKLQPDVQTRIDNEVKLMKLQHPIVGFHVRRTDKITEVPYQPLDAYFSAAEVYFSQLELLNKLESNTTMDSIKRRVLIATDEPSVIQESRKRFPQYEILASDQRASTAGTSSRQASGSLLNLLIDIFAIIETDYVVCTMSSNVCKVLHQLRQTDSAKAHNTYFVDLIFPEEFFGQRPRQFRVMYAQTDDSVHLPQTTQPNQNTTTSKPATGYLVTEVGDVIEFLQYEPYGLAVGVNNRTKQKGLFYLFKTEEVFNFFNDTLHSD